MSSIIGKVVELPPAETVTSQRGSWIKQYVVIETSGEYPKKICFQSFQEEERDDVKDLSIGDEIEVFYNLTSNKWKDRWFTEARLWKIKATTGSKLSSAETINQKSDDVAYEDDLPF